VREVVKVTKAFSPASVDTLFVGFSFINVDKERQKIVEEEMKAASLSRWSFEQAKAKFNNMVAEYKVA
jgi:hypothetical protein